MTRIARYIDDPPQFLLWDIDELVLFDVFFGMGILTNTLVYLLGAGTCITYFFSKVKKTKSEGILLHAAYWLAGIPLRNCLRSHLREFIE